eukprot:2104873-Rhodomonas_salina.1
MQSSRLGPVAKGKLDPGLSSQRPSRERRADWLVEVHSMSQKLGHLLEGQRAWLGSNQKVSRDVVPSQRAKRRDL